MAKIYTYFVLIILEIFAITSIVLYSHFNNMCIKYNVNFKYIWFDKIKAKNVLSWLNIENEVALPNNHHTNDGILGMQYVTIIIENVLLKQQ